MKVSRIEIKDFQQFKDFQVDLTYPKGHEKAGEPLDKVCFIGQSGTGKTTLLELIKQALIFDEIGFFDDKIYDGEIFIYGIVNNKHQFYRRLIHDGTDFIPLNSLDFFEHWFDKGKRTLIYLSYNIDSQEKPSITFVDKNEDNPNEHYYRIDKTSIDKTWKEVNDKIIKYQNGEANFRLKELKRYEKEDFDLRESLDNWSQLNPNPLEDIGKNCLNKILNQLFLKVKTDIDSVKELNSIQIEKLDGTKTIDYEQLSTGTRQFIFTALPLYLLETKDAIILIDEPETSLYPDIQRQIVPTYSDLAPEAQFFYATHSPVILSSFEPWEIIVLEFDKEGFVQPKKMYKGERHVDNYMANPRYLRWDDILTTYLGLDEEGSEERIEMRHELAILGNKLKHLNGGNDELKQQLWKEYSAKAKQLGWGTIHEK
ncbi:MAG: AAA family ATPase [Saprospiraceae bacterium]